MNHLRRTERDVYAPFQPSAYSGGIQPYAPMQQLGHYGDLDNEDLERQGSFTDVYVLRDRVDMLDDYSLTRLTNYENLQFRDQMKQVAANNAEALLKVAYWLKVAWLASGGALTKVDGFKSASDGYLKQGLLDAEKPGSASLATKVTDYYMSAFTLLKSHASEFNGNEPIYQTLLAILNSGTKKAEVEKAQDQLDESQDEEQAGRDQAKCEDSILGFIPGYCEHQMVFKTIGGLVLLAAGLFTARGVYKQFAALKREVEKK
jgi:hypothetical protein